MLSAEYAAGFWEADGYCVILAQGWTRRISIRIGIEQKDKNILDMFSETFGGKVTLKRCQNIWTWMLNGYAALSFLQTIQPFLKTYRMQRVERFIRLMTAEDQVIRAQLWKEDKLWMAIQKVQAKESTCDYS